MKNQPFLRLPDRLKTVQPFTWLLIAYGLAVLLLMLLNGYSKHLETYMDERIYYSMAEGLAKGLGFPTVVGEPYSTNRYLYSLLIAPAFLTGNRLLQFRLIALLNALAMCSGAFPVYLLAKDVLKDRRSALLAGLLFLIQPDLQFTAGFMTENLWLPVALWVIFFSFKLTTDTAADTKQKGVYLMAWLLLSVMLVYIKQSGYVVVVTSCLWLLAVFIARLAVSIKRRNMRGRTLFFWAVAILALGIAAFVFFRYSWLWDAVLYYIQSRILKKLASNPWLWVRCYLFSWASAVLAVGIFPVLLPLLSFRCLSREGKSLFCFLLLLTAIANLGVTNTSLGILALVPTAEFPLYHRYIIYLWLPYLVVFMDVLRGQARVSAVAAVLAVLGTAVFCFCFHGAVLGNAFEASLMYWARGWMQHRFLWIALVILFVVGGFVLLPRNKKVFVLSFAVIMLGLQAYNSVAMHRNIKGAYQFSYPEIGRVESFIRENPDETFLVVTVPTSYMPDSARYNAKIADTYLLYPNSFFASDAAIMNNEGEEGIDLTAGDLKLTARRDLRSVDCVVLTNEMMIDESACEPLVNSRYFTVFRLNDPASLPFMKRISWGENGVMILHPWNGFYSKYVDDGTPTFVSTGAQDHVLFGPYVTLPAGAYNIAIHYSYDGTQTGRIGLMDLAGSAFTEGEYRAAAFSDQDSVALSFHLDSECTGFEARLFAEAAGIRVESIEVEYEKSETMDGAEQISAA